MGGKVEMRQGEEDGVEALKVEVLRGYSKSTIGRVTGRMRPVTLRAPVSPSRLGSAALRTCDSRVWRK